MKKKKIGFFPSHFSLLNLFFPQIRRKITAKALWRWFLLLLVVSILTLQIVHIVQNIFQNYYQAQLKQTEKQTIEAEIVKWQEVARVRPDYRDAYFELAVLTYRLDRLEETKKYLSKVFELDPNYQPARELEQAITR